MKSAKPVSSFVTKVLSPIIEQRAGMSIDLIANWEDLVGEEHGANSRPKRIIWPRETGLDPAEFSSGTLELSCSPTHALFLQHDAKMILGRINTYFGFTAVTRIKIDQLSWRDEPETKTDPVRDLPSSKRETLEKMIENVEDSRLQNALRKLGKGVFSDSS